MSKKNKYPIYIPSRGRWESRQTVKALEEMDMEYFVVVEPREFKVYASVIDKSKILKLPKDDKGLVFSRNWIKKHSIKAGAKRHWQLDDNISGFVRLNHNTKIRVTSAAIFRAAEDFTDRYKNIAVSGFQYRFFAPQDSIMVPFKFNERIYSISLVNNKFPLWWRDTYNDDTDLCLRAFKDGWATILFYAFLANKAATMTVKGGLNTEEFYQGDDGRLKMAESLVRQHPDVTKVTKRWGRFQHVVDYSRFRKNDPQKRKKLKIKKDVDNYGMILINKETNKKVKL